LAQVDREVCEALGASLASAFPKLASERQAEGHMGIAAMQLRLGRPQEGLAQLAIVLQGAQAPRNRAAALFLKTLCLEHLGSHAEAQVTFGEGQTVLSSALPIPFAEAEGFFEKTELEALVLSREAKALITENRSSNAQSQD
jgi:hypothetical protein